jgi:TM2 domain-containing membrane protein YozV
VAGRSRRWLGPALSAGNLRRFGLAPAVGHKREKQGGVSRGTIKTLHVGLWWRYRSGVTIAAGTGGFYVSNSGLNADIQASMGLERRKKSSGSAFALWLVLGGLGGHRFYLGRTGSAMGMIALTLLGWSTISAGIGFVLLGIVGVRLILDLLLIPAMVNEHNTKPMVWSDPASVRAGRRTARPAALEAATLPTS